MRNNECNNKQLENNNFMIDNIPLEREKIDMSTSAILNLSHLETDLSSDKRSENVVVLGKAGKGIGFKGKG